MDYSNADTFSRDYLCVELMSKFPSWDIGVDRTAVAKQKFFEVESVLAKLDFSQNPRYCLGKKTTTARAIMMTARNKIAKILGECDLDEIYRSFAFGPGASTSMPRRRGDAAYKFGAIEPHVTYNALPLADALLKAHPTWHFKAKVVDGSRLITVPKNAKTDRTICIEPDLNMYCQKGLGKIIRRRLQRWGLLLPDAQDRNAALAREGSANGRLATVDLSSASDSIHLGLVGQLLPSEWCNLIELMRSPQVVLPTGQKHLLRKVSSMGNGFTFELETLIFYGVVRAVMDLLAPEGMDLRCTVFGDDIVVGIEVVPVLEEVFSYLGFVMNTKKTFSSGPFRESCGKHYFAGTDVSPFYVRSPIDSVLRKYWAANTIRRYSRLSWGLDSRWQNAYQGVVDAIPSRFRGFKIPEGCGDGGLVCDWDEATPVRAEDQHDAWVYRHIAPRKREDVFDNHGTILKVLHTLELSGASQNLFPPNVVKTILFWERFTSGIRNSPIDGDTFAVEEDIFDLMETELFQWAQMVSELQPSKIPQPQGHRIARSTVQRWSSFGPWL
jgi:hypothetical protein